MKTTRIQMRGTCSICNKFHAVTDGVNVATHGYTVAWNTFNDACSGSNAPHYGHENAPAHILTVVAGLERYLLALPAHIEAAKSHAIEICADKTVHSYTKSVAKRRVAGLERQLSHDVPTSIVEFKERAANWKPMPLVKIDLEVEVQKAKDLRLAEKAKKDEVKRQAEIAKVERQAKAEVNANKRYDALIAHNYLQLFYKGEVVKSWDASYEDDRSQMDAIHLAQREHYEALEVKPDTYHWMLMGGSLYTEVRTKPDGKGRKLLSSKI